VGSPLGRFFAAASPGLEFLSLDAMPSESVPPLVLEDRVSKDEEGENVLRHGDGDPVSVEELVACPAAWDVVLEILDPVNRDADVLPVPRNCGRDLSASYEDWLKGQATPSRWLG